MFNRIICLLFLIGCSLCLSAQLPALTPEENAELSRALDDLRQRLRGGEAEALLELTGLLEDDRPTATSRFLASQPMTVSERARDMLVGFSDFAGLPITAEMPGGDIASFLRSNNSNIRFSPLLQRFTDTAAGSRDVRYELQPPRPVADPDRLLANYREEIARAVSQGDYFTPVKVIPLIAALRTPESLDYLEEMIAGRHWGKGESPREGQVLSTIGRALGNYETLETAQLVLKMYRELGVPHKEFRTSLAWITGISLGDFRSDRDSLLAIYENLVDSLPSIPRLRELGYQQAVDTTEAGFASRADYLAYLVAHCLQRRPFTAYHALRELEEQGDQRLLPLLAGVATRYIKVSETAIRFDPVRWLERLTGVSVWTAGRDGTLQPPDTYDKVARVNAYHYWARYAEDYDWSAQDHRFIYRGEDVMPIDSVSVLIDQLYGHDDEGALRALTHLIRYPLDTLHAQLKRKSFFLMGANKALPFRTKERIYALAEVRAWCTAEGVPVELPADFVGRLEAIDQTVEEQDKDELIVELAAAITPETATALEIWTYLNERRFPRAHKAVVEQLKSYYAARWSSPLMLNKHLRLFALQSVLARKGRAGGVWSTFPEVAESASPERRAIMEAIQLRETDERIRSELEYLLLRGEVAGRQQFTLAEYLMYSERGVTVPVKKVMLEAGEPGRAALFAALEPGKPEQHMLVIRVIDHFRDTTMTPYLLAAAEDTTVVSSGSISYRIQGQGRQTERFPITTGDMMIGQLEMLYGKVFHVDREGPPEDVMVATHAGATILRDKRKTLPRWRAYLAGRKGEE